MQHNQTSKRVEEVKLPKLKMKQENKMTQEEELEYWKDLFNKQAPAHIIYEVE